MSKLTKYLELYCWWLLTYWLNDSIRRVSSFFVILHNFLWAVPNYSQNDRLFTLHWTVTGSSTGKGTGTTGNNGFCICPYPLSVSTLFPVLVQVTDPCSVTRPSVWSDMPCERRGTKRNFLLEAWLKLLESTNSVHKGHGLASLIIALFSKK